MKAPIWSVLALLAAPVPPQETADVAFDQTIHPAPPDYSRRADWAVFRGGDKKARADVFFIQPTTFVSRRWNQDLADTTTDRWTRISVGERQINAFDVCCRIYSPRYRQASSRAFTAMQGDGAKAYALAYGDVRAAFRWYIAHENHGRPFLIVGHSQGSLHALRLIEEEVDRTSLARRLIVAYAPGIGIPLGVFGDRLRTIGPCDTPTRTRCLASWNSFTPDADVRAYTARSAGLYTDAAGALLCVNPLTFDMARPAASAAAALGGLLAPPDEHSVPKAVAHAAAAACRGGVLRVETAVPLTVLPGGVLHFYDIPLFWADLRANTAARLAAFPKEPRP